MKNSMFHILRMFCTLIVMSASLVCAGIVHASETDHWQNFVPPPDAQYDWIQLSSGEWLKGELISLYNFSVEFDSDELDFLSIDWEDIAYIRSARLLSLRIEDSDAENDILSIIGLLQLNENMALLTAHDKMHRFNREDIISIASGAKKESRRWTGKIAFGANIYRGNTDNANGKLGNTVGQQGLIQLR